MEGVVGKVVWVVLAVRAKLLLRLGYVRAAENLRASSMQKTNVL